MPDQTLGGIPLGLGMVMKINFFEFSCTLNCRYVASQKKVYLQKQLKEKEVHVWSIDIELQLI